MHAPPDDRENDYHSACDDVSPSPMWCVNSKHKRRDEHPDAQKDVDPTTSKSTPFRITNSFFIRVCFLLFVRSYFLYPFLHNFAPPLSTSIPTRSCDVSLRSEEHVRSAVGGSTSPIEDSPWRKAMALLAGGTV